MNFKATKAFGKYAAGSSYSTSSPAEEAEVRRAIAAGDAQEGGAQDDRVANGGAVGQTEAGGKISPDGKSVVLDDGSRGSIGAQQLHPEKGPQVRDGVTGKPT